MFPYDVAVQPELLEDFDGTDDRYVFGIATLCNSNFILISIF